jgi:molecular chaperone GrpE (heat shock protein)
MTEVTAERIAALSGHVSEEYLADLRAQVDGDPEALAAADADDQPETIEAAEEEIDRLETRIEALSGHLPDAHVDQLTERRDELRADVEYSRRRARGRNALGNALKAAACAQSESD